MNQTRTSQTAILVFAHSPAVEANYKAIARADALFDALTDHTLKTVEKTGLPYFHINEQQQIGSSFGERFANAIRTIYNKGYERIITIGNDSPQLTAKHILVAESQLKEGKFVLGPSTDGGFYLMGLHKDQFNLDNFQQLAWQTNVVSKQLIRTMSDSVAIFRLPALFDIDTVADIKKFISSAYHISNSILLIFLSILFQLNRTVINATLSVQNLYFKIFFNKGSPLLLQSS